MLWACEGFIQVQEPVKAVAKGGAWRGCEDIGSLKEAMDGSCRTYRCIRHLRFGGKNAAAVRSGWNLQVGLHRFTQVLGAQSFKYIEFPFCSKQCFCCFWVQTSQWLHKNMGHAIHAHTHKKIQQTHTETHTHTDKLIDLDIQKHTHKHITLKIKLDLTCHYTWYYQQ